jgi:tetratricopeptide (TPR) repeat protein
MTTTDQQSALRAALETARQRPEDAEALDALEGVAGDLQSPEPVAELYVSLLSSPLSAQQKRSLGDRALRFCDEWFGDDAPLMQSVLRRLFELDPHDSGVFDRLALGLTAAGRWDVLLDVYNDAADATDSLERKARLLDEAVRVAKDLARDDARAITLLDKLAQLRPRDAPVRSALERLLERNGRHRDLIALWDRVAQVVPPDEAVRLHVQSAELWFEKIHNGRAALELVRRVLAGAPQQADALAIAERVLAFEDAAVATRKSARDLLADAYGRAGRPLDVARVLRIGATFAPTAELPELLRRAADLSVEGGDRAAALDDLGRLLALQTDDEKLADETEELARELGAETRLVEYLDSAAQAAGLPRTAAKLRLRAGLVAEQGKDFARASVLFDRVFREEGELELALQAGRALTRALAALGQHDQRTQALERLAALTPNADERRDALSMLSSLSTEQGDHGRAVRTLEERLRDDPTDRDALDALVRLHEEAGDHAELADVLGRRAKVLGPTDGAADLGRVAELCATVLADLPRALENWEEIARDAPDALPNLPIEGLLGAASKNECERSAALLAAVGHAYVRYLDQPEQALPFFERALAQLPGQASARLGLDGLLALESVRARAAEVLACAFAKTQDHEKIPPLLVHRVSGATSPGERATLLRECASLEEHRLVQPARAFEHLSQAFLEEPRDASYDADLRRLASATSAWDSLADALAIGAAKLEPSSARAAQLFALEAELRAQLLSQPERALEAYGLALRVQPTDRALVESICRVGAALGQFREPVDALVTLAQLTDQLPEDLLRVLEQATREVDSLRILCRTAETRVLEARLGVDVRRAWLLLTADWLEGRAADPDGAERVLSHAAVVGGTPHVETLRKLATLQRKRPSASLHATLLTISNLVETDLDPLVEAERLGRTLDDEELRRGAQEYVLDRSAALLTRGLKASGTESAETCAIRAATALADAAEAREDHETAVAILRHAALLAIPRNQASVFAARAAALCSSALADHESAAELYQRALAFAPDTTPLIAALAATYETLGRPDEQLTMLRRELALTRQVPRRLALRLDIARVHGVIEARGARVASLAENLREAPGHEASLEALALVLKERGTLDAVYELLAGQAAQLESLGDAARAADLWMRAARFADVDLRDESRALTAFQKVATLRTDDEALEAVSRMRLSRNEPVLALPWLERRLARHATAERVDVRLQLAQAYRAAGDLPKAVQCLAKGVDEAPDSFALRDALADLYRSQNRHHELADLLADCALRTDDDSTMLRYGREASRLFCDVLRTPSRALDVLSRAVKADPEDRALRCAYADCLTDAGRLLEARTVLDDLVTAFGRRRSPERAEVHLRLSRVARAENNLPEALAQLETASAMDRAHVDILRELGELSLKAGELDRAERAFRALLMAVRRPMGEASQIGVAEVLFQLHRIADQQGQKEQSGELLDSMIQTAVQSDAETKRLKKVLVEVGESELLLKVLELRLRDVGDARAKAAVLADIAEVQERGLRRPAEALDTLMRALAAAPDLAEVHDATLRLAVATGSGKRYVEALRSAIDDARAKDDAGLVASLALRVGAAYEHSLNDLTVAKDYFAMVGPGTAAYVEALFSLSRVAGKRGQQTEERESLRAIVDLPETLASAEQKQAARYRLAELHAQTAATRERGLAEIMALLEEQRDYDRAIATLTALCDAFPEDAQAMELLERVARQSGEPALLLEFIERHARTPAPTLALVREGAELCLSLGFLARGEALLRPTAERLHREGRLDEAPWAAVIMARLCSQQNHVAAAIDWFERAFNASTGPEALGFGLTAAQMAADAAHDPERSIEIYEALRSRDPEERRVIEPLLELYETRKEFGKYRAVVVATAEAGTDPQARARIRLDAAQLLARHGRDDESAAFLREVLSEDPDHEEAMLGLAGHYERKGDQTALADLLRRKLESAMERRSPSIVPLAVRMGELLAASNPEQAASVYRDALAVAPENPDLLRLTLSTVDPDGDPEERVELAERYLSAVARGDVRALPDALWLVDLRTSQGDELAIERALALASKVAPGHADLTKRLEQWYRSRGDHMKLAQYLEEQAQDERGTERRLALLTEAADLRLDVLHDPGRARDLLQKARQLATSDLDLLRKLVKASVEAGDVSGALSELDAAIAEPRLSDDIKLGLQLQHAQVAVAAGLGDLGLHSLEAAYARAGAEVLPAYLEGLAAARKAAAVASDSARDRDLMLRTVRLLDKHGRAEAAIEELQDWTITHATDNEAAHLLMDVLLKAVRPEDVLRIGERLVELDDEAAIVETTRAIRDAARALGQPNAARVALERALQRFPGSNGVVQLLEDLYAETADHRALASLLSNHMRNDQPPRVRFEQLRRIGKLLLDAGEVEAALAPLTSALELKQDDVPTVLLLADATIEARRFHEAQDLLDRAMNSYRQRRSPELAQLRYRMAKLAQAAGDPEARLEWLSSALDADMNNGEVASELSVVAQHAGDLDLALKALRAVTMLKTDAPMSRAEAFYRQAVIVAQKGEPRRAVLWAKKAKAEDATLPGIDELLAELGDA